MVCEDNGTVKLLSVLKLVNTVVLPALPKLVYTDLVITSHITSLKLMNTSVGDLF